MPERYFQEKAKKRQLGSEITREQGLMANVYRKMVNISAVCNPRVTYSGAKVASAFLDGKLCRYRFLLSFPYIYIYSHLYIYLKPSQYALTFYSAIYFHDIVHGQGESNVHRLWNQ